MTVANKQHQEVDRDAYLAEQVKNALLRQTDSAGIDVRVSAGDGVIRLHGVVDVLSHKRAAEEIARRIPGVADIANDITIANEETATDKHLLQAISQKLNGHDRTRNIGARVTKGTVTLVGHAGFEADVDAAIALVEDTAGVREVRVKRVKIGEGRDEDDADVSRQAERLLTEMGYDEQMFEVYCDAGVLFVKGLVPTGEDRSKIKQAMHTIPGVDKLDALLVPEEQIGGEIH